MRKVGDMLGWVQTAYHRGSRKRGEDDRGMKGIFGEFVACLARSGFHTAVIVALLVIFDKIPKPPTMNLP